MDLIPTPMLFYPAEKLCQAWVTDALLHGSVAGFCRHLRLRPSHFYQVQEGTTGLPTWIVERLGLMRVTAGTHHRLIGYLSQGPVDFAAQWEDG